jgi:magnesium chelatase subunit D
MSDPSGGQSTFWEDAVLAASMLAIDPQGLAGVHVRARHGAVRDRWLALVSTLWPTGTPVRRIAGGVSAARLTGGLDIGATIERGRPVLESGVLAAADGGVLVLAMAERLDPSAAAVIGMALDDRAVRIERDGISAMQPARFALIALDEGIDDEGLAPRLADRLGLRVDLDTVGLGDMQADGRPEDVQRAKALLPAVAIPDALREAACAICLSLGLPSIRPAQRLVRAAAAAAALRGADTVEADDLAVALRLVLGLRLSPPDQSAVPEEAEQPEQASPEEPDEGGDDPSGHGIRDMVVQAERAVLPPQLLSLIGAAGAAGSGGSAGKSGQVRKRAVRGRVVGTSEKPPSPGARLDVLATLRQAAPWQRLRGRPIGATTGGRTPLRIRKNDFRYPRFREMTGTTVVFAVDASGSAAMERLAETKGAIELLLADCYVRRDQVAMLAFRGKRCETLLEPTRSLVRAKRSLSALPGGGGTPLASGILATLSAADAAARRGQSLISVFLTDGRGNVALDGGTEKAKVAADVDRAARMFRASGLRSILIDTGNRPQARAAELARSLGAEYLAMPRGGSSAMAREIGARMEG